MILNKFGIVISGDKVCAVGGFMGTRRFSKVEEKNSRIKWAKADPITKQKLSVAINKYSHGLVSARVARVLVFIPSIVLLVLLIIFLSKVKNSNTPLVVFIIFFVTLTFFTIFFLIESIKFRPYLYPERQHDIWIFRARCEGRSTFGQGSDEVYFATFQKGGGHISIRISGYEYDSNPIGTEYIFYKFNDRCGNQWAAIEETKLDKF